MGCEGVGGLTRVVLPAPWTPFRPMKKGRVWCFWWEERRDWMKGMTVGVLSSCWGLVLIIQLKQFV